MLNIPYIQQRVATFVAKELSHALGSEVQIKKIDIGLLNRIIIDDLLVDDQTGEELLKVTRLSAKFDIFPLFSGKVSINNVQLFGFNVNLSKENPESATNFQFILDAFAKKEKTEEKKNIDLRINSLLIRRGKIAYNLLSAPETPGHFNPNHINIKNVIANISLKAFQNDSINAIVKRLSIEEGSGLDIRKLTFKLTANEEKMLVDNFSLQLPNSSLNLETLQLEYDSLAAFMDFTDNVHFKIKTEPSYFTPQDISPFTSVFSHFQDPIELQFEIFGSVDQIECPYIEIHSGNILRMKCEANLRNLSNLNEAFIFGNLSELYLNNEGINFLIKNLAAPNSNAPALLNNLGDVSFQGEITGYFTDLVTYGTLKSNIGAIKTDLKISSNIQDKRFSYSGSIQTDSLNLGKLLNNSQLGKTSFYTNIKGSHIRNQKPDITLKGLISNFTFRDYNYEDIQLDGKFDKEGFNGNIALYDSNGTVTLDGIINLNQRIPTFDFLATVQNFTPHNLNLTTGYEDVDFSVKIRANFAGNSIDNFDGEINVDDFSYNSPDKDYFLNNLRIMASHSAGNNRITVNSEFIDASVSGEFKYRDIPISFMKILHPYLPSLIPTPKRAKLNHNNFKLNVYVSNTEILSTVFNIPIHLYTPVTLKGYINDESDRIQIEAHLPRFKYDNKYFESGALLCSNNDNAFSCELRLTQLKSSGAINLSLLTAAQDDKINTTLHWGNNAAVTYSGRLNAIADFAKTEAGKLRTTINLQPTNVILNDSIWKIHPAQAIIEPKHITINDFNFSHGNRYLSVDGIISEDAADLLTLKMNDINIGYVFDIANISNDVDFEGDATGSAYASNLFAEPVLDTHLLIKKFSLNDALLGDLSIYGAWHNETKGIYLDAIIKEENLGKSFVKGYIYPTPPNAGLDLNIKAENLSINFIQKYTQSVIQDLSGRVSGDVHFYGKFKGLTLDGAVMTDASMRFDILNTRFMVNDSIYVSPEGITFSKLRISDPEGNAGNVDGYVHYHHFKDVNYRLDIHMNNMLVMNTKESPDFPFYGTVYATGNALLTGNAVDGLNANIAVTTNRNTTFTYSTAATVAATSNQFITFVDKTPKREVESIEIFSHLDMMKKEEEIHHTPADIRLNLLVDATPDATMKIIIDPVSGDYISARGNGNIRTEFFNKGGVRLFGTYNIQQGIYKFSLQEVIRKDFLIRNGSSITFNGPPIDAILDIQAYYTVSSASLNDLIPDASSIVQQPNIRVNCMMNLTGNLTNPTLALGIELPNERDEIQALVRNYISTEEQMNMQMLYLLGLGKFYMESTTGTRQSDMMTSVLSSTLSGQLNNVLSQIIDNNNWNIGTNLSTGEKGWTDVEVEGILSGQLLNNRLLINGNFGYRDNPMSNTNFIGDFEAEWLLNQSGDIRLKAYNETNDRYYTKTNLTTQGIGILFKKDFNKWNDLFIWNQWKIKKMKRELEKLKKKEKEEEEIIDIIEGEE